MERPLYKGMIYIPTKEDEELAIETVNKRQKVVNDCNLTSRPVYDNSIVAHRMGVWGEIAFARMAGIEPELGIGPFSKARGTDGFDNTYRGNRIDVKRAEDKDLIEWWRDPPLLKLPDYYVLIHQHIGPAPTYTTYYSYEGAMAGKLLCVPERIVEKMLGGMGKQRVYAATVEELIEDIPWKVIADA